MAPLHQNPHKNHTFKVVEFCKPKDFGWGKAQNAGNPLWITEYFNKATAKILVSKSDSSLNVLASVVSSQNPDRCFISSINQNYGGNQMKKLNKKTLFLVTSALIAAGYTALTYMTTALGLSFGGVQFRISEAQDKVVVSLSS